MRVDSLKNKEREFKKTNRFLIPVDRWAIFGVTLIVVFSAVFMVSAWQNPSVAPPGGDLSASLNTGSTAQTKTGTLTIATSTYLATTGGNVGIGTTAPGEKLEVVGVIKSRADTNNLIFANAANSIKWYQYLSANDLRFWDTVDRVTIQSGGNVGIGTTGPTGKLTINSTGQAIRLERTSFNPWSIYQANPGSGNGLGFYENDANYRLFIQEGGNVGIGTTGPTTKLDVADGIKSTMWKVTQVYNMQPGALPLTSSSFSTGGGTLLIIASGSGYNGGVQIGMSIAVDGIIKGYAKSYSNEGGSHKAFTTNPLVVTGITAGSHTITLASWNGTSTDANDFFTVTVLELPF